MGGELLQTLFGVLVIWVAVREGSSLPSPLHETLFHTPFDFMHVVML